MSAGITVASSAPALSVSLTNARTRSRPQENPPVTFKNPKNFLVKKHDVCYNEQRSS